MIWRVAKMSGLIIVLFHFLGATQYLSYYAKNDTSFVNMMTMAEEESKKEKDQKEFTEDYKDFERKNRLIFASPAHTTLSILPPFDTEHLLQQHISEQLTPPPNFTC